MPEDFKVKVGQFEGPLELVLDLIEKRKLHISDVSLSQIADEFIEYTRSYENFPIADSALNLSLDRSSDQKRYVSDLADFILVASTLLLIKSKSLLPNLSLTEEEQGSIEDLENRLAAYKKYKELALNIEKMFGNFLYFAEEKKKTNIVFSPTPDVTLLSLKDALQEVIKNMPQKIEELPKVMIEKIISLEETIDKLRERIQTSLKTSFSDFAGVGKVEKVNVIVSFLAMLELVKQGLVRVNQNRHFEDIEIEGESSGVPTYY